jgi:putative membrane protein
MYYYQSGYFGMHFIWWCFWVILWVSFFSLLTPVPRRQWKKMREAPKDILLRRLASGEISEKEFESRTLLMTKAVAVS